MNLEEKLNYIDRDIDSYVSACKAKFGEMPDTVDELREYLERFIDTPDAKAWISKYEAHGDKPRNSCWEYLIAAITNKIIDPVSIKMRSIEEVNKWNEESRSKFKAFRQEYIKKCE